MNNECPQSFIEFIKTLYSFIYLSFDHYNSIVQYNIIGCDKKVTVEHSAFSNDWETSIKSYEQLYQWYKENRLIFLKEVKYAK